VTILTSYFFDVRSEAYKIVRMHRALDTLRVNSLALWFFGALSVIAAIRPAGLLASESQLDSSLDTESPFVICEGQRYALCAEANCFVYDGVASCKCDIMKGNSISLQLSYSSPAGEQNVCDLNAQGVRNGYMVSTFSLPSDVTKGGNGALYTCPRTDNMGSGVEAPVAYGQCDGGICYISSNGQRFPGFGQLSYDEIICACPISTAATEGSTDGLGYQVFGPFHPKAPIGSRCDPDGCAQCSVPNPLANGSMIPVGAASGTPKFLALRLDGPPLPKVNECMCKCSQAPNGSVSCTTEDGGF
jgi:hypothetical protein